MKKTVLALSLVALSATVFAQATQAERELQEQRDRQHQRNGAQPAQPAHPHQVPQVPQTQPRPRGPGDVMLNPQPLPPRDHRWDDVRDHRQRDRDFRTDRDHRHWNDYDHRRNYEVHRSRLHELRLGMRKSEVLRMPWWQHPLYVRDNGPFDTYIYADGRHGKCVLSFQFNRLAEIDCD